MNVEHVAFQVKDPVAMAEWYEKHLGFRVVRSGGPPGYGRFIADSAGHTVLEIYNNPDIPVPDYASMHPMTLHLAVLVKDVKADADRLIKVGANNPESILKTPTGDEHMILRDPWGLCLQLMKRSKPLL